MSNINKQTNNTVIFKEVIDKDMTGEDWLEDISIEQLKELKKKNLKIISCMDGFEVIVEDQDGEEYTGFGETPDEALSNAMPL